MLGTHNDNTDGEEYPRIPEYTRQHSCALVLPPRLVYRDGSFELGKARAIPVGLLYGLIPTGLCRGYGYWHGRWNGFCAAEQLFLLNVVFLLPLVGLSGFVFCQAVSFAGGRR